jgi:hypothetical protein
MAHFISYPSSDNASYKQWTTSSGTNHYALIDEGILGKNTSDYVYPSAAAKRDQYIGSTVLGDLVTQLITAVSVYMYINASMAANSPGLTLRLYQGATQKHTSNWSVDSGGVWVVYRFDITGLSIDIEDGEIQVAIISFDGPIPPTDPVPVSV